MFKRPVLYASLASLALIGCATKQEIAPRGCTGANCTVLVSITPNCQFTFDPDELKVPRPFGMKLITWRIVSQDFMFTHKGIVVEQGGAEFDQPHLSQDGKEFRLRNRHTLRKTYRYAANVLRTGNDPGSCGKDPLIVNE